MDDETAALDEDDGPDAEFSAEAADEVGPVDDEAAALDDAVALDEDDGPDAEFAAEAAVEVGPVDDEAAAVEDAAALMMKPR